MPESRFSVLGFHGDRILTCQSLPWFVIWLSLCRFSEACLCPLLSTPISSWRKKVLYPSAQPRVCHVPGTQSILLSEWKYPLLSCFFTLPLGWLSRISYRWCNVMLISGGKYNECALDLDFQQLQRAPLWKLRPIFPYTFGRDVIWFHLLPTQTKKTNRSLTSCGQRKESCSFKVPRRGY